MNGEGTRSGASHFFLNALRIGAGVLFMQHGAQKLFGVLGARAIAEPISQFWFAGILEFWGGLLIVLGLFTRPVAVVLAVEMVWAYVQAHLPRDPAPIQNQGELALLYLLIWLLLAANGPGGFSLDGWFALRARRKPAT